MMQIAQGAVGFGRIITGSFFILAGVNKIISYSHTQDVMANAGLWPMLLPAVIVLEIGGGSVLTLGRGQRVFIITALALTLFTLATNLIFHRFWLLEEPFRSLELSLFFKNLVIAGALISFAGFQASISERLSPD